MLSLSVCWKFVRVEWSCCPNLPLLAGITPAPIEALNVGIASEAAEGLKFTFYERAAGQLVLKSAEHV